MNTNLELNLNPGPRGALSELGGRLVRLCDGRPGLRSGLRVEVREPAPEADPGVPAGGVGPGAPAVRPYQEKEAVRPEHETEAVRPYLKAEATPPPVLEFIASDETLDRYGEILSAEGWRLEAYRRNPVFQNAHQYGDILFTLGRALDTAVRDGRLWQRIEFATAVNPMARIAYGLYRGKFLNAVSVGFLPRLWENGSAEAGYRRRYLEQELLEVSAVGIPANPNALALGLKSGAVQKADLQEALEYLRLRLASLISTFPDRLPASGAGGTLCSSTAAPNAPAGVSGVGRDETQLLQLARALRKVLHRS